LFVRYLA